MTLADFTGPALILARLRGLDGASVIQELGQALHRGNRVPDLLPFYHAALNREFLGSTSLEPGLAFPHARLAGLKELSFALGRSQKPLSWWGASTRCPLRLVFLLAVPATDSTQYLQLISGLSRLAKDTRLVENLHAAPDSLQMLEVLRQIPLRSKADPDSTKPAVAK